MSGQPERAIHHAARGPRSGRTACRTLRLCSAPETLNDSRRCPGPTRNDAVRRLDAADARNSLLRSAATAWLITGCMASSLVTSLTRHS